jgi:uncharacterized protein YjiS (DUF1127 family)
MTSTFAERAYPNGEVALQNILNRQSSSLKITGLETLREPMPSGHAGRYPFLGWSGSAIRQMASRLAQSVSGRRARLQFEPLDDHTLNDIGVTRVEATYWAPK